MALRFALLVAAVLAAFIPSLSLNEWFDTNGDLMLSVWNEQMLAAKSFNPSQIRIAVRSSSGAAVPVPIRFEEMKTGQGSGANETTIRYTFDRRALASDMYTIDVTALPGFARDAKGDPIMVRSNQASLYIPAQPPGAAYLTPGQQFIDAENAIRAFDIRRVPKAPLETNGALIPGTRLELHPITLTRVDRNASPARLEFRLADGTTATLTSNADALHLPGLLPLISDSDVRRLAAEYGDRDVWTMGRVVLDCVYAGSPGSEAFIETNSRLHVNGVYRIGSAMIAGFEGIGSEGTGDRSSGFSSIDPIVLDISLPQNVPIRAAAYADIKPTDLRRLCATFTTAFSGAWDAERSLSLKPVQGAHPDWPSQTVKRILNGNVRKGMTQDMIAWMFGYPSVYGTIAQMRNLPTWNYDLPTPDGFTIAFKRGRVSAYDPPGFLP